MEPLSTPSIDRIICISCQKRWMNKFDRKVKPYHLGLIYLYLLKRHKVPCLIDSWDRRQWNWVNMLIWWAAHGFRFSTVKELKKKLNEDRRRSHAVKCSKTPSYHQWKWKVRKKKQSTTVIELHTQTGPGRVLSDGLSFKGSASSMLPKSFVTQLPARFVNIKPQKLRTVKDT